MTVAGLYRDLYGVRPKWNRLYLEPHLTPDLYGTSLGYRLRGQDYQIQLGASGSRVSVDGFSTGDQAPFAVAAAQNTLRFYPGEGPQEALTLTRSTRASVEIAVNSWPADPASARRWSEACRGPHVTARHTMTGLRPGADYALSVGGTTRTHLRADAAGAVRFLTTLTAPGQQLALRPAGG